jgi:SEC-C motif
MTAPKVGRNELCPCGSGKKYKLCCLHLQDSSRPSHPASSDSPLGDPVLEVFSTNMLLNRVDRESARIAKHFDALVHKHIVDIDLLYSSACKNLLIGKRKSDNDQDNVRTELAVLLTNQLKSFTAAFSLLRTGWRLQPFLCIRNSYEALSVVLHLFNYWEDLANYKQGKLKSTTTFNSAKKLLPLFGQIYGQLSEEFTHIGLPFGFIQEGSLFSEDEKLLWFCLVQLAYLIWFTFETTELVFYDYLETRIFWNKAGMQPRPGRDQLGQAYMLSPTAEAEALRKRIFSAYSVQWDKYFRGAKL